MTDLETTEFRKHLRVDARVTVSYLGPTKNLSAGGMCVIMDSPLAIGSEVELEFGLPGRGEPVRCSAQVVWSDKARSKCEVGLVFLDISEEDRARVEDFVVRYAS
jgi:uncharacterized protein (TIGR02266 family)